jgi:hypothetical protein
LSELLGRELAQLIVDHRQKLLGGVWIAFIDGAQNPGDVGHDPDFTGQSQPLTIKLRRSSAIASTPTGGAGQLAFQPPSAAATDSPSSYSQSSELRNYRHEKVSHNNQELLSRSHPFTFHPRTLSIA